MPKVGDVVVTMSYPGLFTVVALDGDTATISDGSARVLKVHVANVRCLKRDDPTPS